MIEFLSHPDCTKPTVTEVKYWTDSQGRLREEITIENEMIVELEID